MVLNIPYTSYVFKTHHAVHFFWWFCYIRSALAWLSSPLCGSKYLSSGCTSIVKTCWIILSCYADELLSTSRMSIWRYWSEFLFLFANRRTPLALCSSKGYGSAPPPPPQAAFQRAVAAATAIVRRKSLRRLLATFPLVAAHEEISFFMHWCICLMRKPIQHLPGVVPQNCMHKSSWTDMKFVLRRTSTYQHAPLHTGSCTVIYRHVLPCTVIDRRFPWKLLTRTYSYILFVLCLHRYVQVRTARYSHAKNYQKYIPVRTASSPKWGVHTYDQYNWYDQYVTLAYCRYRNRQLHIICHINLHILHIRKRCIYS